MKRALILIVAVIVALSFAFSAFGAAEDREDLQAIKKAVKENPGFEAGKEVKWFKVLVTDAKTGKDKVKVTLPIAVLDIVAKCAKENKLQMHREDFDIDLAALFKELKAAGPMMFIEVYEEDEIVKVWME